MNSYVLTSIKEIKSCTYNLTGKFQQKESTHNYIRDFIYQQLLDFLGSTHLFDYVMVEISGDHVHVKSKECLCDFYIDCKTLVWKYSILEQVDCDIDAVFCFGEVCAIIHEFYKDKCHEEAQTHLDKNNKLTSEINGIRNKQDALLKTFFENITGVTFDVDLSEQDEHSIFWIMNFFRNEPIEYPNNINAMFVGSKVKVLGVELHNDEICGVAVEISGNRTHEFKHYSTYEFFYFCAIFTKQFKR